MTTPNEMTPPPDREAANDAGKPATGPSKSKSPARPQKQTDPSVADIARGANGLNEFQDMEDAARGLMAAQVNVMNTMVSASMSATTASLRAMTQFWTAALPKGGKKD
jgi:hypothetical protein